MIFTREDNILPYGDSVKITVIFVGVDGLAAVSPSCVILSGDRPNSINRPSRSFAAHPYGVILERSEESRMGALARG